MQTLEIISVNFWQILISLLNLLLIFFILKKFLWKPVKKVMAQRQAAVDEQYAAADEARAKAEADRAAYEEALAGAKAEAKGIVEDATVAAKRRGDQIVAEAEEKADRLVRQAQSEAELEKQKAENEVKQKIVDVSALLAGKLLEREISADDHRTLIDAFINNIDDNG